jgi:polysaccharide deacetylase family protein (PEP-CTERM system associated)
MLNALSIDVEDYYQVSAFESAVRFEDWGRFESRVEQNTRRMLDILESAGVKATFFILGWVAEQYPQIVRAIHNGGHEVASHGYRHRLLYNMQQDEFREDTRRAKHVLEDICGKRVYGYRAASYSVIHQTLWCLDVLEELGFSYDSSIFPIHHDRYGMPEWRRFPHHIPSAVNGGIWEFPISTVRLGKVNFPIAGGGYLRLLPYRFIRWALRHINQREEQPAIVYLHPWELDPHQPRLQGSRLSLFRHYVNLAGTEGKLVSLLRDFRFAPVREVIQRYTAPENIHQVDAPVEASPWGAPANGIS